MVTTLLTNLSKPFIALHLLVSGIYREQTSGESKTTLQEKYTIFINNTYSLSLHIIIDLMLHVFNN